jgi:hypothetical protein
VRAGRLAGPLPVVDRADARGPAARPGAVCVLRGTRSAGGGACPAERAHCRVVENHHFAGGWPARATALPAACPTGQGMAQVRALLDWLPDPTRYHHRRRLFRDGEHPGPRVAWLGRPLHRWIPQLGDLPNMIHPPLLGVVNAPSAVSTRTLTCRAGAPVPQIAAARAERVRSLDPDIARVEPKGIAAFDAVPLERLQEELRHGCIAVVRIEYINVLGAKTGTLVHSAGGAVGPVLDLFQIRLRRALPEVVL